MVQGASMLAALFERSMGWMTSGRSRRLGSKRSSEYEEAFANHMSGVKISDTDFSGSHAAICASSKPESNLTKNSPISSARLLQPTLEWGRILL